MCRAMREVGFAIRAVQHEKLSVCAARFRLITERPTWRQVLLRFRKALADHQLRIDAGKSVRRGELCVCVC